MGFLDFESFPNSCKYKYRIPYTDLKFSLKSRSSTSNHEEWLMLQYAKVRKLFEFPHSSMSIAFLNNTKHTRFFQFPKHQGDIGTDGISRR